MVTALAALALVVSVGTSEGTTEKAVAADASNFNAGSIISDANFYDNAALSVSQIQSFLNSKIASCAGQAGLPCLNSYAQTTVSKTGDRYCAGFGVNYFTAAQIIEGVQRSCGVSSRALLVLLQKEQSLVTSTSPSSGQYRSATGYGCPDTADCDTAYYGFFNQVYAAARQFKIYQAYPTSWRYQAGRNNYIQYNPDTSCGGSNVYIQNQATAGLYVYTPYQPNATSLANLYGSGDRCGAYGNRNFWRIYSDWFGPPTGPSVSGGIGEYYLARGGESGSGLGAPLALQYTLDTSVNGWVQYFENGQVYWSPATQGRSAQGWIGIQYTKNGGPVGTGLGYPTSEQAPFNDSSNGWSQSFQGGKLYWTPSLGVTTVLGAISTEYDSRGGPLSSGLGYPVADTVSIPGGTYQQFENGRLFVNTAGAGKLVSGGMLTALDSLGGPIGSGLGFPLADSTTVGKSGTLQQFSNGNLYSSPAGAFTVPGGIGIDYALSKGWEQPELGLPVGRQFRTTTTTWAQVFEHGTIHWSGGVSQVITGVIRDAFDGAGGPLGSGLGIPTDAQTTTTNGLTQNFQYGHIDTVGSTATVVITSTARAQYYADGGPQGPLGSPVNGQVSIGNPAVGWYQQYANGRIYDGSNTLPHRVSGGIGNEYVAAGGPVNSGIGFPVTEQQQVFDTPSTGWNQQFETGSIYWSSATGAVLLKGELAKSFSAAGGPEKSGLGYPTSAQTPAGAGLSQQFESGLIYWSAATGARVVPGGIAYSYSREGGPSSNLGFPTSDQYMPTGSGWAQKFANGTIYYTGDTGSMRTVGAFDVTFNRWGGPVGSWLGYPAEGTVDVRDGTVQVFQSGRIYQTSTGEFIRTSGGIGIAYVNAGGNEYSGLGYPTGPQHQMADGGWVQSFESGQIYWSAATGSRFSTGAIGLRYAELGGPIGTGLGYPTSDQANLGGGAYVQYYERGRIEWRSNTGPVVIK